MTGWVFKTEFLTETPLEHGNWSAVEFETAEEAWEWWRASTTLSNYPRVMTLTDPGGRVVEQRHIKAGARP